MATQISISSSIPPKYCPILIYCETIRKCSPVSIPNDDNKFAEETITQVEVSVYCYLQYSNYDYASRIILDLGSYYRLVDLGN